MAVALNRLTSKTASFKWEEEQQLAFEQLKKALTEAPVLKKPDYTKPWRVEVDASDTALGAVLAQEQEEDSEVHPSILLVSPTLLC